MHEEEVLNRKFFKVNTPANVSNTANYRIFKSDSLSYFGINNSKGADYRVGNNFVLLNGKK
jgi:hypothetical protein